MNNTFNYNSLRAKEARLGKKLSNSFIKVPSAVLAVVLAGFGIYALINHASTGWILIGLATIILVIYLWEKLELKKVPCGKTEDITDIISSNCLAALPKTPTPQSLVRMLYDTRSGRFIGARFAITPDLFLRIANELPNDMTAIYNAARGIRTAVNSRQISGGIMIIATIQTHPNSGEILRRMKLDIKDLYDGIVWYNYLHGLVADAKKHKRTGGIARDFSFGYIPLLQHFGQNISVAREGAMRTQIHRAEHAEIIEKMVQTFTSGGRQNIALVGAAGTGRTTIVNAFADKLLDADSKIPADLKFRQIFMLDASRLISAAPERGQIEGLVSRLLGEAYAAKNIILYLDNAHLFFEEGTGSVDISNILLPILEAGRLRIILTIDQQKFLEISAKNSALANALNKVMVTPATEDETMKVMEDQVPVLEFKHRVVYLYLALREAYRLSERYVHDLEMPGRALSLLEAAAGFAEEGAVVTEKSVQLAVEKTEGVKVQSTHSTADREKLLQLEGLIHQRMIDQEEAVKTISDALRRAAAGVRSEKRPIGTFLFLGPTGVGKTELAKAISEVYFGGEDQIVRIDLNEYVSSADVSRLIAEASEDEMSLTAQVMKRPFSVVLLDEIEKAHPQVLTTLLQMLDEGILRDSKNHEVSFRDAIVVATSNAGADKIREYIDKGVALATVKEQLTNELIVSGEFKPEFLNRFDEICIFTPLSKENLIKVIDLMIRSVNKTLADRKISVALNDEARELLVERGYDPKLGARPMRRIVQKTVENLVAKAMLSGEITSGEQILITREMVEEQLS